MRNASLRARLLWGLALMLTPLLIVSVAGLILFHGSSSRFAQTSNEIVEETDLASAALSEVLDAEGVVDRFTQTAAPGVLRKLLDLSSRVNSHMAAFEALDEVEEQTWARIAQEEWGEVHETISGIDIRSVTDVELDGVEEDLDGQIDLVVTALEELSASAFIEIQTDIATTQERERAQIIGVLVAILLAAAAAVLVGLRLHRSIVGPVGRLQLAARRLSEEDLSHRIGSTSTDELGRLSQTFDEMANRLEFSRYQLREQALHDALTGLPNRILLLDRIEHALTVSKRHPRPLAVIFLDLDDFKAVNDTLGHAHGDELLIAVGDRIKTCLRPSDTFARLGGDEFAILLEEMQRSDDAAEVAARVHAALLEPIAVGTEQVVAQASIGIAYSASGQESAASLVRDADVAMYAAKASGRGRSEVFNLEMQTADIERLRLEADLSKAVDQEEFILHYQPIFDLQTKRMQGVEALIRWKRSDGTMVSPLDFIPAAERTGMILPIGRWVMHQACAQVRKWQKETPGADELGLSINVSGKQMQHGGFIDEVKDALRSTGLEPRTLTVEITETIMMTDVEATIGKLEALRALGVKVAVDDFGTGYSSLSYLQRFPLDVLKIDKTFVDGTGLGSFEESALARAIVKVAHGVNLGVVAEGIEREEQLDELIALGCQGGQGYLLARPLEPDAVALLIAAEPRRLVASSI